VQHVQDDEVSRYGIVDAKQINDRIYTVSNLIEKPKKEVAPSNLAIVGRYILSSRIFDILDNQNPGAGGEIQLTDAIAELNLHEAVYAYNFEGTRYDVGEKLGFIKTQVEFALKRDELRSELLAYLHEVVKESLVK
jgi:UTP--glucose-1-phosphate uridylyltransferase